MFSVLLGDSPQALFETALFERERQDGEHEDAADGLDTVGPERREGVCPAQQVVDEEISAEGDRDGHEGSQEGPRGQDPVPAVHVSALCALFSGVPEDGQRDQRLDEDRRGGVLEISARHIGEPFADRSDQERERVARDGGVKQDECIAQVDIAEGRRDPDEESEQEHERRRHRGGRQAQNVVPAPGHGRSRRAFGHKKVPFDTVLFLALKLKSVYTVTGMKESDNFNYFFKDR